MNEAAYLGPDLGAAQVLKGSLADAMMVNFAGAEMGGCEAALGAAFEKELKVVVEMEASEVAACAENSNQKPAYLVTRIQNLKGHHPTKIPY